MAVQRTSQILRLVTRVSGGTGGSCGGPHVPPPCPLCSPRPPPPCRARKPGPPQGVRVVCCPPRATRPPPCPPASCSLTCSNVTRQKNDVLQTDESLHKSGGLDCVAWRLQCAKRMRQLDYEREVAARKNESSSAYQPPPVPYTLGAERELARATDGRLYAISRSCGPQAHCSCTGEPPSPRPVALEESNRKCHIGDDHLNPCAHRPRVFLEIDRSSTETSHECESSSSDASCANRPHGQEAEGGAGGIGDFGWCKSPPSFPGAPNRCRPLSIVERLRSRPSRLTTRNPHEDGVRRLHTSTILRSADGGLQELLKSKELLHKAGQGRVVVGECSPRQNRPKPPDGNLDLCVPPGTSRVRVHVCLDGIDCSIRGNEPTSGNTNQKRNVECQTNNYISQCKGSESWLSIKNLQKKLSGRTDAKVPSLSKENKCPHKCKPPPCTPCPTPPVAPPRQPVCPRPSCPESAPPGSSTSKPHVPCGNPTRRTSSSILIANSVVPNPS